MMTIPVPDAKGVYDFPDGACIIPCSWGWSVFRAGEEDAIPDMQRGDYMFPTLAAAFLALGYTVDESEQWAFQPSPIPTEYVNGILRTKESVNGT